MSAAVGPLLLAGSGTTDDVPQARTASILLPAPTSSPRSVATSAPTPVLVPSATPKPRVVVRHIPYPQRRKDEMARYSAAHYGERTWKLAPKAVVLHFTESDSVAGVIAQFRRNTPNRGELPGVCAHYLVAKDGTVYELVPPSVRCRHAIGLNHRAIGIEVIQSTNGGSSAWADRQILARTAQVRSLLQLVASLQARYGIATADVVGHGTANASPWFRDRKGWRNTHTDWGPAAVTEFRRRLVARA